jgi:putative ubiquitin-RnfH superfamily antitoxin RatB of RatAB toxin-antitoxin module
VANVFRMVCVNVEVVYALAQRQWRRALVLLEGATVRDALAAVSGDEAFAALDLDHVAVGIWGRVISDRDRELVDGDRIEIYRPLVVEPMEARRGRDAALLRAKAPRG